ncbi:MAG: class I SAM-dependent methyltransferase [Actinomycetota bacterium]|nr:class I SAM-dependent methyltransferase [Actinomycetota bacterium]
MSLADDVAEVDWYHTLVVGDGIETKGLFDIRPFVHHYGLPDDLSGKRALDVGTWDGFWAFEMERRGAEVVCLDVDDERELDIPPRRPPQPFSDKPRDAGFKLAREALGSSVQRVVCNVYDATAAALGEFDLVFCGSVLIHLRDQFLALERIAGLVKPGGTFISAEEYEPRLDLLPFPASRYLADRERAVVFWLPSRRTWRRMLWSAGFDEVSEHARFKLEATAGWKVPHVVHHATKK